MLIGSVVLYLAVAAACVTHPNCLIFFVDLCFLTLYLDAGRILRVRALAVAAAPYLVALGGWGLYIMEEPGLFARQFFGNAGGTSGGSGDLFNYMAGVKTTVVTYKGAAEAQKDDANPDADEDVAAEDKVPSVDVTLKETKRILLDLVGLSIPNTAIAVHN